MQWNVKIEELPDDGGYQFKVTPRITPEIADHLLDLYGKDLGGQYTAARLAATYPCLEGHGRDRAAVAYEIKSWVTEQEKKPITVFEEVIEL